MKPADVYKIYELIMMEYDKLFHYILVHSPAALAVRNDIAILKDKLESLATFTAPTCASGAWAEINNEEIEADAKIMASSLAAFQIASKHLENVQDCNSYIDDFRTTYEAALRVELYRQFLGIGQDFDEAKVKFIKRDPTATLNLQSLMDFIFEDINKNIVDEINKFKKVQDSVTK